MLIFLNYVNYRKLPTLKGALSYTLRLMGAESASKIRTNKWLKPKHDDLVNYCEQVFHEPSANRRKF